MERTTHTCDRCGKEFTGHRDTRPHLYGVGIRIIDRRERFQEGKVICTYDICEECKKEAKKLWHHFIEMDFINDGAVLTVPPRGVSPLAKVQVPPQRRFGAWTGPSKSLLSRLTRWGAPVIALLLGLSAGCSGQAAYESAIRMAKLSAYDRGFADGARAALTHAPLQPGVPIDLAPIHAARNPYQNETE